MQKLAVTLAISLIAFSGKWSQADLVDITNAGFEDVTGLNPFNEFHFGIPTGWDRYDPNGIEGPGTFWGTLQPNGVDFFNSTAPEGDQVAILFNSGREGEGEYGIEQTLTATLQANTRYTLSVQVGNIASGTAQNGVFFDLDEFPGYRIDVFTASGSLLASDNDSLVIPEGEFSESIIQFDIGGSHANLGEQLGIRLVNLNQIPNGHTQVTSPDLEVDFDQVVFDAAAIPEPNSISLLFVGALICLSQRRKKQSLNWLRPDQDRRSVIQ